jgi:hypothetical protein
MKMDPGPLASWLAIMHKNSYLAQKRARSSFCTSQEKSGSLLPEDRAVRWILDCFRSRGIDPGKVESSYGAEGEGHAIHLTDPERNVIELKGPSKM